MARHVGMKQAINATAISVAAMPSKIEIPQLAIESVDYSTYNWSLSPDGATLATSIRQRTPGGKVSEVPALRLTSLNGFYHPSHTGPKLDYAEQRRLGSRRKEPLVRPLTIRTTHQRF